MLLYLYLGDILSIEREKGEGREKRKKKDGGKERGERQKTSHSLLESE